MTNEDFQRVMKTNMNRFMKDVGIDKLHFPPVIDMENIRIKKYTDNGKDQFGEHVDVLRSKGPYYIESKVWQMILRLII